MQDRDIINDLMGGAKASINSYTMAIVESSNPQLRSTWQTLRTEAEQMHYQLYQMAEQKGYYMPAPPAHQQDVQKIKSGLSSTLTQSNNTGSNIYSTAGTSNMNATNSSMSNSTMSSSMNSGMPSSNSGMGSSSGSGMQSSSNSGMQSSESHGMHSSTYNGMHSSSSQQSQNMTNSNTKSNQKKKNK